VGKAEGIEHRGAVLKGEISWFSLSR